MSADKTSGDAGKMWHEARKQEKKIRGLMVDYKKRAERRREFYEKIKADPAQFVRVFGQACKVNLDPAVAIAAESPQSMMPWQGDSSNMIDRFDVRAHLDILPPEKSYPIQLSRDQESEERRLNYERYRIIVENESSGLTEEQALHQLYLDEQYGAINKDNEEEKNKLKDKKAAIGYQYEDSTPAEDKDEDDSEESEEEEDIETLDLDIVLDVDTLTEEQIQQLNLCGTQFGMGKSDYIKYLKKDKDEQEALKLAKMLEEEKAQFAGRKSRRERRIYKEKRLAGRKLSPPSYAARDSPKYEPYRRSSSRSRSRTPSRSRSRSRSPKRSGRKMYITSFGEVDSDEGEGVMHGPALPPGLNTTHKQAESTNKQPGTWDAKEKKQSIRKRFEGSLSPDRSPESKDREYVKRSRTKSGSRSRDYRSHRSRSRGHRSRSRSRERRRSRDRGYRSRSRDRGYRAYDWRSRDRDSRRSPERSRYRRSGSYSRRSRSRSRRRSRSRSRGRTSRAGEGRPASSYQHQRSRSRSWSRSSSSSRSKSRSRSSSRSSRSKSKSQSPVKQVIKRYRRDSLSSKSSESEEDNSSNIMPKSTYSSASTKPPVLYGTSSSISQAKLTPQERLKRRMQLALNKQFKADKKAEIVRQEKLEQEKMDREEELRQRALEMRRREREKRHREIEERYDSDDSNTSDTSLPGHQPDTSSPVPQRHGDHSPAPKHRGSVSPVSKHREAVSPASKRRAVVSPPAERRGEGDSVRQRRDDNAGSSGGGRREGSSRRWDGDGATSRPRDRGEPPPRSRRDDTHNRSTSYRSRSRSRSPERRRIVDY